MKFDKIYLALCLLLLVMMLYHMVVNGEWTMIVPVYTVIGSFIIMCEFNRGVRTESIDLFLWPRYLWRKWRKL